MKSKLKFSQIIIILFNKFSATTTTILNRINQLKTYTDPVATLFFKEETIVLNLQLFYSVQNVTKMLFFVKLYFDINCRGKVVYLQICLPTRTEESQHLRQHFLFFYFKKIPTFRTKSRSVPTLFAIHSTTTLWEGITKSNFEQNEFRNPSRKF